MGSVTMLAQRIDTAEALRRYCRKCGAPGGSPCVYLPPPVVPEFSRSEQVLAARARAGTATKRPHNERYENELHRLYRWLKQHGRVLTGGPS